MESSARGQDSPMYREVRMGQRELNEQLMDGVASAEAYARSLQELASNLAELIGMTAQYSNPNEVPIISGLRDAANNYFREYSADTPMTPIEPIIALSYVLAGAFLSIGREAQSLIRVDEDDLNF